MIVQCEYCKKEINKTPSNVKKYKHHFCSRECRGKWNSKTGMVKKNCFTCKKEFEVVKSREKTAKYCSVECYDKYQSKKKKVCCTNCEKEIQRKPSQIKVNNFCSNKCVGKWNGKQRNRKITKICSVCGKEYRVQQVHANSVACSRKCQGKWFSNEYGNDASYKEFRRQVSLETISKQTNKSTTPEIMVEEYLRTNNIEYIPQQLFYDKFVVDFYLPHQDIIIEVQGNYWHGNPKMFGDGEGRKPLTERQKKQKIKDKGRFEYLRKAGHNVYPVWEQDIYEDIDSALYFLN